MPLTDIQIKSLKPLEKIYKKSDGGGLYLEIPPTGNKRWRLAYRFDGKQKILALGIYPQMGLRDARERREEAKKLLRDGCDPSEQRKVERLTRTINSANSFEEVAREWFSVREKEWRSSHAEKVIGRLCKYVFPYIGDKPTSAVKVAELLDVLRRIEVKAPDTAHRVRQDCERIYQYAIRTERAERNIGADLRGVLSVPREEHYAAVTDPQQLALLLRDMWDYKDQSRSSLFTAVALRLTALLPVRQNELRHMEWSELDFTKAEWAIPAAKMKMGQPHIVPLPRQALALLEELRPLSGRPYVFPNYSPRKDGTSPCMSGNTVRMALRKMGYGNDVVTPHGFRATFRTLMDEVLEERIDIVEQQLAHEVRDPLGRAYNRTKFLKERKRMMQRWADYLDELRMEGNHSS